MKRLFPFIVTLCMLLVFAACGNNSQPDNSLCEHTFCDWIIERPATCIDEGLLTRTCTTCSHMEAAKIGKTNTHTEVIDPAIPATCEKTGLSEGKHCSVCEKVFVSQQETPIVAHTYDDKYDESCNVCGHIRDAECAHKEIEVLKGKSATCTEIGLTEGCKCKKCGEILVEQTVLSVLAHSFGQWVTVKEATTTEEGLQERTCDCGAKETQAIEKLQGSVGLDFALNSDRQSYAVTGIGTCTDTHIVIPGAYDGLPVTTIRDNAFKDCDSMTGVTIPDSVTFICDYAFSNCDGLISVPIPGSVTFLGSNVFHDSDRLTSVTIGSGVTEICSSAFSSCDSLASVTIPNSVTTIAVNAFNNCDSLIGITIPDSVTYIGNYAFEGCDNLISITIPDSVTTIGYSAFSYCSSLTSVTFGCNVTEIGYGVFYMCHSLASVTVPNSVTTIGKFAFYECTKLNCITYEGTIAQWGGISKDTSWVLHSGDYKIYCIDGRIDSYGNIIYN